MQRTRKRALIFLCLLLLLVQAGVGQAATPSVSLPAAPPESLTEWASPDRQPAPAPAPETDLVERNVSRPAGLAAPGAGGSASGPVQPMHQVSMQKAATGPVPAPSQATAALAEPARSPARVLDLAPVTPPQTVQPGRATAAGDVRAADTLGSYTLTLSRDVFGYGVSDTITATVTRNGLPAAGATVLFGGIAVTTGANGSALYSFTAPTYTETIPVRVQADGIDAELGALYVMAENEGVLVVNQVRDRSENPVFNFYATMGNSRGIWGRSTGNGQVAVILPAEVNHVEITAGNLFLYQTASVAPLTKTYIHPSGTGTVPLTVTASLDGSPVTGQVALHSHENPYISYGDPLPDVAWVTPGTYSLLYRSGTAPEAMLVGNNNVTVNTATTVPLAYTRAQLGRVNISGTDGHGEPLSFQHVTFETLGTQQSFGSEVTTVLAQPDFQYKLEGDSAYVQAGDLQWDYQFHYNENGRSFMLPAGAQVTLNLGGPVTAPMWQRGQAEPGRTISVATGLRSGAGEQFQARYRTADYMYHDTTGTLRLLDAGGNTLMEREVRVDQDWSDVTLPANAQGSYRVTVDYPDLGPYQGPVHAELPLYIAPPESWTLSLSNDTATPDAGTNVTATVRLNGAPAANAEVRVDRDGQQLTYTTGADGTVTFYWAGADRPIAAPVSVMTARGRQTLGFLYVVPPGYGVLTVRPTDRSGQPSGWFGLTAYYFSEFGGSDINGRGSDGAGYVGMVRPAGTNYVEAQLWNPSALFLYGEVQVVNGGRTEVSLNGADTVPVTVTAAVDGQSRGVQVYLHNQAMPGRSWPGSSLPGSFYATPGTYTVAVQTNSPEPTRLTQTNVAITATTAVMLDAAKESLAKLTFQGTGGHGAAMGFTSLQAMPGFIINGMGDLYVTPGHSYYVPEYQTNLIDPADASQWSITFGDWTEPAPDPVAPGEVRDRRLGGPATFTVQRPSFPPIGALSITGLQMESRLTTADGHRLQPSRNGQPVDGELTVKDSAGRVVWTDTVDSNDIFWIFLPNAHGTYTLEGTWDLGPYQGIVTATPYTFTIGSTPTLTLSQRVVPVGVPTQVTVTATRDGVPLPNYPIDLDWNGSVITDANGQASFWVDETFSDVMRISSWDGGYTRTLLFVLDEDDAGIELTANDRNGQAIHGGWGSATVETGTLTSSWSSTDWESPIGLIVPAGDAFVQMVRDGAEAYFFNGTYPVTAGTVTDVHFDGRQAAAFAFTATGDAMDEAWISLRSTASVLTTALKGLQLNPLRTGTAYVTPGQYHVLLQGKAAGSTILVPAGVQTLTDGGSQSLNVASANLGRLVFETTLQGAPVVTDYILGSGPFDVSLQTPGLVLAAPGDYSPRRINVDVQQAGGETWDYEYRPETSWTITTSTGQPERHFNWELAIASAKLKPTSSTYTPGSTITYRLALNTADGWQSQRVRDNNNFGSRGFRTASIRDAGGNQVYYSDHASYSLNSWRVPATGASSLYNIAMTSDIGRLGNFSASAVVTLKQTATLQLQVSQEILPAGQTTPVTLTLSYGGLPLAGAPITISGESTQTRLTDSRGQVHVSLRPEKVGLWQFSYQDPTRGRIANYAYALTPGYGVVSVMAIGRTGPMLAAQYEAMQQAPVAQGWQFSSETRKMILKSGPVDLVYRAYDAARENYYLTTSTMVRSMNSDTVLLPAFRASQVWLSLQNTDPNGVSLLYLRNTAMPYTERNTMGVDLRSGTNRIWVTPGEYDLAVVGFDPAGQRLAAYPRTTLTGGMTFPVAIGSANTQVAVQGADTSGAPLAASSLRLKTGGISLSLNAGEGQSLRVTPGNYTFEGGRISAVTAAADERWSYDFSGARPLTVRADEPVTLTMGGPLAPMVKAPAMVVPGGTVPILATLADPYGLHLTDIKRYQHSTNLYLGSVPMQLEIIGPGGYATTLSFGGDTVSWTAPLLPGTYNARLLSSTGPLGATPEGTATMQVTAPPRRF